MAWTHYQCILALLMVVSGSFNTLSVKYADRQVIKGEDGQPRHFNHPFMQSSFMFIGEMLCLVVFKVVYNYYSRRDDGSVDNNRLTKGSRVFNPLILFIPALCDTCATSLMYIGLNMTYASSFQMLRGAVIIFTAILSMGYLNRKLESREWIGIGMVIVGLALVGLSDIVTMEDSDMGTNSIITGDLLVICAQVITAVQMVVEEKFVVGENIPALQAVGWEGIFGFIAVCIIMIPLNFIHAPPPFADNSQGTLEATKDAFVQIGNSGHLLTAILGITFSIAFFNFAGISVTKEMSATTRMILDSARTVVIWGFSLALKWQSFHYLQLIGFSILLTGMSCYNNIVVPQLARKCIYYLGRHRPPPSDRIIINTAADDLPDTQ
ncbi:transport and golgi organization 9 [Nomia melanderi]|uniref:transport and golgi organization 9 n=1 Tax=Nomia melanderi TaxID=2448451 RepID=UPI0013043CCF|nr:solute carrier family 35 member F6 [Nomia melanderi]XP_031848552.1 solute carrier family 35 member F6 [Nomia melanderi]XP_031848553.1 solute carrier family 35 member F6 [Nomia melanderi]XP_031848554.1 solute carrier family 35 member F6 [Nomia melanderi]XP_031848555.1 solute carrier family 35 member F6 [Nomia melanderi]XP_031848556.1 solute carrier family 35 member F6 [Nomia melanderi]XP_031848558.1 solute carrier family 35 member F6 [Nomia melanderi]XP_031848559.1 solute carrier family 35